MVDLSCDWLKSEPFFILIFHSNFALEISI